MSTKKITMDELRGIVKQIINEDVDMYENVIPIGGDGSKITDNTVVRNLNLALKSVSPTLRTKLSQIITDPNSVKELQSPAQRSAMLAALAVAFGITESEFTQVIPKIKSYLPKENNPEGQ